MGSTTLTATTLQDTVTGNRILPVDFWARPCLADLGPRGGGAKS
jgi:hypothetical protein